MPGGLDAERPEMRSQRPTKVGTTYQQATGACPPPSESTARRTDATLSFAAVAFSVLPRCSPCLRGGPGFVLVWFRVLSWLSVRPILAIRGRRCLCCHCVKFFTPQGGHLSRCPECAKPSVCQIQRDAVGRLCGRLWPGGVKGCHQWVPNQGDVLCLRSRVFS